MYLPRMHRSGLTLLELTVVLVILIGLAGVLVPLVTSTGDDARKTTTRATLKSLRDAVLTYYQDMKGITVGTAGETGIPRTLADLQIQPTGTPTYNAVTKLGWRGPYLQQATGRFDLASNDLDKNSFNPPDHPYGDPTKVPPDPAFLDGWGSPIVLQWPTSGEGGSTDIGDRAKYVRLVSAGDKSSSTGKHRIDTDLSQCADVRGADKIGMDMVLFIRVQDKYP